MTKRWYGSPPTACDLCSSQITHEFFDSRTRSGGWGNICRTCWQAEHGKLGTGNAQRYMKLSDPDGDWLKVEQLP